MGAQVVGRAGDPRGPGAWVSHLPSRPQNLLHQDSCSYPRPSLPGRAQSQEAIPSQAGPVRRGLKALTTEQPGGRCWPWGPTDVQTPPWLPWPFSVLLTGRTIRNSEPPPKKADRSFPNGPNHPPQGSHLTKATALSFPATSPQCPAATPGPLTRGRGTAADPQLTGHPFTSSPGCMT